MVEAKASRAIRSCKPMPITPVATFPRNFLRVSSDRVFIFLVEIDEFAGVDNGPADCLELSLLQQSCHPFPFFLGWEALVRKLVKFFALFGR